MDCYPNQRQRTSLLRDRLRASSYDPVPLKVYQTFCNDDWTTKGATVRVSYFGQACTLIEVGGTKILTDPWLTEGAYFGTWFHTHLLADAGVTPDCFSKDVDYLFLSHEHEDHVDPETLRHFPPQVPVLICKFPTPRFRHYLESLGLRNIRDIASSQETNLASGVSVTIFGTAEYTNDAALLVEGDGCRLLNETDCKLSYLDL